ncbi:hypothetical protein Tco_1092652 [Tanacetum coccineum]|uniref:Glycine-rich protein n=1 Tax=Tanacetum coccineum TaxID=301880 RepID=A0ABQ5IAG5_9ASTR
MLSRYVSAYPFIVVMASLLFRFATFSSGTSGGKPKLTQSIAQDQDRANPSSTITWRLGAIFASALLRSIVKVLVCAKIVYIKRKRTQLYNREPKRGGYSSSFDGGFDDSYGRFKGMGGGGGGGDGSGMRGLRFSSNMFGDGGGGGFEHIFSSFGNGGGGSAFGGGSGIRKAAAIERNLPCTLEELYKGTTKKIKISRHC